MRILIATAVVATILCLSSGNVVFGQAAAPPQGKDMRLPTDGSGDLPTIVAGPTAGNRPDVSFRSRSPIKTEPRVLSQGPLAPSAQDRANHESFLSLPNTGLIRLLAVSLEQSKSTAERRHVVDVKSYQNPPINGDGAFYSFAHLTHEYGYGSDLWLSAAWGHRNRTEVPPDYELAVASAGADFGMLTNLGETPLATLTLDDPRAKFMRAYEAPWPESEARSEGKRFWQGVTIDNQTFTRRLPVQIGATYLLRSINYNSSDVLVAFRVERQDNDQSLIIAWKMLKKFGTPKLDTSQ